MGQSGRGPLARHFPGSRKRMPHPVGKDHRMTSESTGLAMEEEQTPGCCIPLDSGSLHDLMGPVNQLCTMADLVLEKYRGRLDDEAETLLGFIRGSAARLQNLVGGLRTYNQIVGGRSPHRLCEGESLLETALALIRAARVQSGAEVTHEFLPPVFCDPMQMSYTFSCLLDNSMKFRGDSKPAIHVSAKEEDSHWIYAFRDNGIGIDPRYSERIFGVFQRIHKDAYPGAGMGLAIAKKIIEGHGGRIWVESALQKGATFFLALPTKGVGGAQS